MKKNYQQGNGSTIAVIIVVIVLLAGAIYMWRSQNANPSEDVPIENELPSDESVSSTETSLNQQSDSDDISSIEADLEATNY